MGVMFDGREFANKIEIEIRDRVEKMARKPKLVAIYDPEDKGSRIYTEIKAKKAEELEIIFEKVSIHDSRFMIHDLKLKIINLNLDNTVDGIMVQTPMEGQDELIGLIDPKKDVDGMGEDSPFVPATVRAVKQILAFACATLRPPPNLGGGDKGGGIVVVGNRGIVGSKLQNILGCEGVDKENFSEEKLIKADVVIGCTGQAGLITPEMVKEGAVCIDVGYPKGDFDPSTALKAGFFTPVPGGVGPVTVAMLFANLVHL